MAMAQRAPIAGQAQEPSILSKLKMGATMGGMVGLTIGFIFGTFAILRNGAGPKGFFGSLSQYMLGSGATFAFFMSIGTVIRTENLNSLEDAQRLREKYGLPSTAMMRARFQPQSVREQPVWK